MAEGLALLSISSYKLKQPEKTPNKGSLQALKLGNKTRKWPTHATRHTITQLVNTTEHGSLLSPQADVFQERFPFKWWMKCVRLELPSLEQPQNKQNIFTQLLRDCVFMILCKRSLQLWVFDTAHGGPFLPTTLQNYCTRNLLWFLLLQHPFCVLNTISFRIYLRYKWTTPARSTESA